MSVATSGVVEPVVQGKRKITSEPQPVPPRILACETCRRWHRSCTGRPCSVCLDRGVKCVVACGAERSRKYAPVFVNLDQCNVPTAGSTAGFFEFSYADGMPKSVGCCSQSIAQAQLETSERFDSSGLMGWSGSPTRTCARRYRWILPKQPEEQGSPSLPRGVAPRLFTLSATAASRKQQLTQPDQPTEQPKKLPKRGITISDLLCDHKN